MRKKIYYLILCCFFMVFLCYVSFYIVLQKPTTKAPQKRPYTLHEFAKDVQKNNPLVSEIKSEDNHFPKSDSFDHNIAKDFLIGAFSPKDYNFVLIDDEYLKYKRKMYLHEEVYTAFKKMHDAAQKDGISLKIISAFRSYDHQKNIWERKWKHTAITDKKKRVRHIMRYSSFPGISRHHWGTEIDINSLNNSDFEKGKEKKVYDWLKDNALLYGFCQVYDRSLTERSGFKEEKWHYSYMPLSQYYYKKYLEIISLEDLGGFSGSQYVSGFWKEYVKGINKRCA